MDGHLSPGRAPRDAVMVGDEIAGEIVAGFAFVRNGEAATAASDRLLVEGDGRPPHPPERPVPPPGTVLGIARRGTPPCRRLSPDRVRPAAESADYMRRAVLAAFGRAQHSYGRFIEDLLTRTGKAGHSMWLVGGGVRDLVAEGPEATVRDVDLTGTAPTGWFSEEARRALPRARKGHLRQKVSDDLVSSLRPRGQRERILEYRALALHGYAFPASGGDMEQDARGRDFTVNSLCYDPANDELVDPTGLGLPDLQARRRRLVTFHSDPEDLAGQAVIVLRAVKFLARWHAAGIPVDEGPMTTWTAALKPDLPGRLTRTQRESLVVKRGYCMEGLTAAQQRAAAEILGPVAVRLLEALDATGKGGAT